MAEETSWTDRVTGLFDTALSIGLPILLDKPQSSMTPAEREAAQYSETAKPQDSVSNISGTPVDGNITVAGVTVNKTAFYVGLGALAAIVAVKVLR